MPKKKKNQSKKITTQQQEKKSGQDDEHANGRNQDQEIGSGAVAQLQQEIQSVSLEDNLHNQQQQTQPRQQPNQPSQQKEPKQQEKQKRQKDSQPSQPNPKAKTIVGSDDNTIMIMPKRPGFGKQGQKVLLQTNFYPLSIPSNAIIHQYDVRISSGKIVDDFSKRKGRKVLKSMVEKYDIVFQHKPVFDGKKILFSKVLLDYRNPFEVEIENDLGRKQEFEVNLNWAGQVQFNVLKEVREKKRAELPQDFINGLDLVLRHASTLSYTPIGSKFFKSDGSVTISDGREIWPGFIVSVRPTNRWQLMLNVDVSATVMYSQMPVSKFLFETTGYDCENTREPLKDFQRKQFSKEIKGLRIKVTHLEKVRRYKVKNVTQKGADQVMFKKDGTDISVANYLKTKERKPISLRYPTLPCLCVGSGGKTFYPLEVCELEEGQRCKKLTEKQTAEMIKYTARKPAVRRELINKIVAENFQQNQYAKAFDVEVNCKMTQVEGRRLDPPEIIYGSSKQVEPKEGKWNMIDTKVYREATINAWGLVIFNCRIRNEEVAKFEAELRTQADKLGIKMGAKVFKRVATTRDSPQQIVTEGFMKNKNLDLLVVILPGKTPFYGCLKRLCETKLGYESIQDETAKNLLKKKGLATQCIKRETAVDCKDRTLAQILLKINAKMGGINNSINGKGPKCEITRPKRVFNEPVLFMGADVTHPGDETSPSIAAVVGSLDSHPSRYAVCVRLQKHRMEIIEDMKSMTMDLLEEFKIKIKVLPYKIIMFRDGVSEGEFPKVKYWEMRAIQEACSALDPEYQPSITFIVVQKRHHARFFNLNEKDTDKSKNCYPGTTIDSVVCQPVQYDYYQFGHAGIQGTSKPSHYHVLHDDSDFQPDELQALSFMLCHLYARCTRSVSIPAPAYYAHHAAFRANIHLMENEDDSVSSSSSGSDETELSQRMDILLRKSEIAKPHPELMKKLYFI